MNVPAQFSGDERGAESARVQADKNNLDRRSSNPKSSCPIGDPPGDRTKGNTSGPSERLQKSDAYEKCAAIEQAITVFEEVGVVTLKMKFMLKAINVTVWYRCSKFVMEYIIT